MMKRSASKPRTITNQLDRRPRKLATVYDAVAGRVGPNGFLTPEQVANDHVVPSPPEKVLLRRVNAPSEIPIGFYNVDAKLDPSQKLPDPDLLKDIHQYVSDFYELTSGLQKQDNFDFDFRSLDETALLAMGILLEEACEESLGDSGDTVFTEPASRDQQIPCSKMSLHQIIGRVVPKQVVEYQSSSQESSEESGRTDQKPRKRPRRRYGYESNDD